jgi:hypothetical protein
MERRFSEPVPRKDNLNYGPGTSLAGKTISVFDRNTGKPLSPDAGYNFGGQLGSMQGIITTPNGDVWALDNEKDQIVYLPKGDATKGRILAAP